MRVDIGGGLRLFVDIDGVSLAPFAGKLVERPTLLLLHGGPGMDHATFKLGMTDLRDIAQVVMYDHRGNGRSDHGDPTDWTLDTWADDVVRLCDVLGISNPIVFGNSFGGFVAQRYLGRHPDHPSKVVLSSTAARWNLDAVIAQFRVLGGDRAAELAQMFWTDPRPEHQIEYLRECGPLYTQSSGNLFESIAMRRNPALLQQWIEIEHETFDTRADLAQATCPVLVLAGAHDPVCPLAGAEEIVDHLPPALVRYERFDRSGHGVFRDEPERAMRVLREFIASPSPTP